MGEPQVKWRECSGCAVATVHRLCASADTAPLLREEVGHDWPCQSLSTASQPDGMLIVWRNPREWLVLGEPAPVAALVEQLAPWRAGKLVAVDLSEALAVLELTGTGIPVWLRRLVDAQSLPTHPGQATGARLADAAATLIMIDSGTYWVVVERSWLAYVLNWFAHVDAACGVLASSLEAHTSSWPLRFG